MRKTHDPEKARRMTDFPPIHTLFTYLLQEVHRVLLYMSPSKVIVSDKESSDVLEKERERGKTQTHLRGMLFNLSRQEIVKMSLGSVLRLLLLVGDLNFFFLDASVRYTPHIYTM